MTDEADSSVVLAELQVALFRECNNQRLRGIYYFQYVRSSVCPSFREHRRVLLHNFNNLCHILIKFTPTHEREMVQVL